MMRNLLAKPRRAAWVAALIVALVIAGVAVAASALTSNAYTDALGVYHACVNSTNGNVRVVVPGDACREHEVAIDWNQTGPPGAPGTASNAYSTTGPGADFVVLPGGEATAATLSLAPGAYAITAKTVIADDLDTGAVYVFCDLAADDAAEGTPNSDISATMVGPDSRRQTVTLMLTHTFTAAGTVKVKCRPTNPPSTTNVVAELTKIVAVKVGTESH